MRTLKWNLGRPLSAALIGLALAAITQIGYAAHDVATETQIAGVMEASQFAPAAEMPGPRRAGRGSPLTLYLEDSSGSAFRLVHAQGAGWRYAKGWTSPDSAAFSPLRKVGSMSTYRARLAEGATPDGEVQTVFIDGPSGFTFVWDREGRWKFVGKIVDQGS